MIVAGNAKEICGVPFAGNTLRSNQQVQLVVYYMRSCAVYKKLPSSHVDCTSFRDRMLVLSHIHVKMRSDLSIFCCRPLRLPALIQRGAERTCIQGHNRQSTLTPPPSFFAETESRSPPSFECMSSRL